jgi:hypothetical protein
MKEVEFMGDKNDKNKGKKKLTKKELKAQNHQKLMEKKASGANSNVIEVNFNRDKKAA